jgi:hypothetical protein
MSNLKYLPLRELESCQVECEKQIKYHGARKSGQEVRLKCINMYIQKELNRQEAEWLEDLDGWADLFKEQAKEADDNVE